MNTPEPILTARSLTKRFGGVTALDNFDFEARPGEIAGLIGPNGAGKTTLFNVLTGFLKADAGGIAIGGRMLKHPAPHRMLSYGVARTFQNLRLIGNISALDNVLLAFPNQAGENLIKLALFPRAIAQKERGNTARAEELLEHVGLAHKSADLARRLSYGQQKLLTLACVLATGADVLLLDEPVAGVHPAIIERIHRLLVELAAAGKAIVVIEHNMRWLESIAHSAVFMDQGQKIAEGTPAEVLADERVLEAYLA